MVEDDPDRDMGHENRFPADDLERLYRQGGLDIAQQIQGSSLNKIQGVTTYEPEAWYIVTAQGIRKL